MPAQDVYDASDVARRLESWLAGKLDGATDITVTVHGSPSETGHSSETILFEADWTDGGGTHHEDMVLRTKPTGHTVFPTYDLAQQFDVMEKVAATGVVPIAPLHWLEPDDAVIGREFLVMGRVDGQVPPDNLPYTMQGWLLESDPADQLRLQRSAVDVLVALHDLDWRAAGLDVLDRPHFGRLGLDQQLGEYEHFLEWGRMGRAQPVLDRAIAWLRANVPDPEPDPVLNWGDARMGNIIFEDYTAAAVLDWEMATLGPREVDVAWGCVLERFFSTQLGVPKLPGFMTQDEFVAYYEERSGYRVRDFNWYLVWGGFRYAAVMMRICQAAELAGIDMGFTEQDNLAVLMLDTMLAEVGAP